MGFAFYTNHTEVREYGILTVSIEQNSLQVEQFWYTKSFNVVLSEVIGVFATFMIFTNLVLGSYQSFRFETSLIKNLYTTDK